MIRLSFVGPGIVAEYQRGTIGDWPVFLFKLDVSRDDSLSVRQWCRLKLVKKGCRRNRRRRHSERERERGKIIYRQRQRLPHGLREQS